MLPTYYSITILIKGRDGSKGLLNIKLLCPQEFKTITYRFRDSKKKRRLGTGLPCLSEQTTNRLGQWWHEPARSSWPGRRTRTLNTQGLRHCLMWPRKPKLKKTKSLHRGPCPILLTLAFSCAGQRNTKGRLGRAKEPQKACGRGRWRSTLVPGAAEVMCMRLNPWMTGLSNVGALPCLPANSCLPS